MNNILVQLWKEKLPTEFLPFLALLLSGDLFFIILHIIHKTARWLDMFTTIREEVFSLSSDLSLAESFQYIKEFWIVALLIWVMIKNKKSTYMGWTLLFSYLLLDDMLSFHEGLATIVLRSMNVDPSHVFTGELRYQDFGELGVSLFFGVLFLTLIGIAYFHSDNNIRSTFHYLVSGLLIVTFFGVAFDLMNRVIDEDTKVLYLLTRMLEDSGEMIGMSLTCWYAYILANTLDAKQG